ncbi:MAG: hypothetical protein IJ113_03875, partial [Eggerthellaceae bacterium]|nr:hypothetical protein [Eggerthellaceae bacterium]
DLVARNDGIVRIFPIEPVQYRHFLPLLSSNSYNSVISCHQLPYFLPERYDYRAALGAGLLHSAGRTLAVLLAPTCGLNNRAYC